ncbi:hypothetical protein U1Q18_041449 [Sarracenia purpurea var. burkii]
MDLLCSAYSTSSVVFAPFRRLVSMLSIWRRNSTLYMPTEAPIQGRYISNRERAVLASVAVVFDHEFAGFRGHGNPLIPGLCNTLSRATPARRVSTIVVACASRSSQASFDSRRRLRHCRASWTLAPCASSSHLRRPAPLRESSVTGGRSHLALHLRIRRHCAVRRAIRLPLRSQRRAPPLLLCLSRRPPPTTAGCLNEFFICTIFRQISDLRTLVFIFGQCMAFGRDFSRRLAIERGVQLYCEPRIFLGTWLILGKSKI